MSGNFAIKGGFLPPLGHHERFPANRGRILSACAVHLDDSDGEEGDGEESDAKENCGENHASNVGEDEEEGRHQPGENQPTRSFN